MRSPAPRSVPGPRLAPDATQEFRPTVGSAGTAAIFDFVGPGFAFLARPNPPAVVRASASIGRASGGADAIVAWSELARSMRGRSIFGTSSPGHGGSRRVKPPAAGRPAAWPVRSEASGVDATKSAVARGPPEWPWSRMRCCAGRVLGGADGVAGRGLSGAVERAAEPHARRSHTPGGFGGDRCRPGRRTLAPTLPGRSTGRATAPQVRAAAQGCARPSGAGTASKPCALRPAGLWPRPGALAPGLSGRGLAGRGGHGLTPASIAPRFLTAGGRGVSGGRRPPGMVHGAVHAA